MIHYPSLSRAELISEKQTTLKNLASASGMPDAEPQKEIYLQLYTLQLQAIDKELNRKDKPAPLTLWQKFKNLFAENFAL